MQNNPEVVNALIEVPEGSREKYELRGGKLVFDQSVRSPLPVNYGFVPETRSGDEDELDILVIASRPLKPGSVVAVRPLGVLEMTDGGEHDPKILAVTQEDLLQSLHDVGDQKLGEILRFFETYKDPGETEIHGWLGADEAHRLITETSNRYRAELHT